MTDEQLLRKMLAGRNPTFFAAGVNALFCLLMLGGGLYLQGGVRVASARATAPPEAVGIAMDMSKGFIWLGVVFAVMSIGSVVVALRDNRVAAFLRTPDGLATLAHLQRETRGVAQQQPPIVLPSLGRYEQRY